MGIYRLPQHVEDRMLSILDDSARNFGEAARDRYAALIVQAMQDVADEPYRLNTQVDPDVDPTARFYHIRNSRMRVADPPGRVDEPRHVLVYEPAEEGIVNILGFIPDVIPTKVALARFIPER